jgi:aspartyl-tRNA(Asn)/glutamyl-tRNA(Gln) amidotransferase subunit A
MVATHQRMILRGRFDELFRKVDALVTPTVAVTAFAAGTIGVGEINGRKVDPHLGWSPFSWPINLAGLPAATVPCGCDRQGLPIGLQIVAPWLSEDTILSVAAAFEKARPWADAWPKFVQD